MIDEMILWKFLKFCIVGSTGMIIDFGTTWLLKERVKINKYIANSTGFILAASSNYLLNRFWTFHSQDPQIAIQFMSFLLISTVGLGINNLLIFLLTEKMRFRFYISKLFAVGLVTLWNFFMNYLITFR
jgi:putative flippase GtrA